jgi:hypothetical protein
MKGETMNTDKTTTTTSATATKRAKLKTDNLRVRRETKKKIQAELAALNRKDLGRKVTTDDYVQLAISLVQPEHTDALRGRTLSNKDRMEKRYQEYCAAHGKVSKDEFIGVLLSTGRGGNI